MDPRTEVEESLKLTDDVDEEVEFDDEPVDPPIASECLHCINQVIRYFEAHRFDENTVAAVFEV